MCSFLTAHQHKIKLLSISSCVQFIAKRTKTNSGALIPHFKATTATVNVRVEEFDSLSQGKVQKIDQALA